MGKRYMGTARTCIKGEAFFESLIAQYAIPHHVVGQKDIGVDYFCEWAFDDEPSGVLFAVQVKTFTVNDGNAPVSMGIKEPRHNALEAFDIDINKVTHLKVDDATLDYWRGFGLPFYLFAVAHKKGDGINADEMSMYYRRFTHVLTNNTIDQKTQLFYRADNGARFRGFADEGKQTQGFARDLFVDLMRWQYFKGNIAWLDPSKLGLKQFRSHAVFEEFVREYSQQIGETYKKAKPLLAKYCNH